MPQRLAAVEDYLDKRLEVAAHSDRTGNGLLVRGRSNIGRIAAALNTSFETIAGDANAGADLLLVHHAPWAEIDLHLHERKLAAARDVGLSLYAAHEALDRAPDESVGGSLESRVSCVRCTPARFGMREGAITAHAYPQSRIARWSTYPAPLAS